MADSVIKKTTNAELLSYMINIMPELKENIDLPVQGESVKPLGQIILNNKRYRNAFINAVNLIGLTIIKRNQWENPWEVFANRGVLRSGQQIREMIIDLAKVHDYNENFTDKTAFLKSEVPNVLQYMHELNFQKYYETTVNETEMYLAFDDEENGLIEFITEQTANLYETYKYDKYLIDKYQLCRRILDGTIPVKQIKDYENKKADDILAEMKGVSNKMTFRSPNYNPAGVRKATSFAKQYLMLDAEREAITSTKVLAKSFFIDEAKTKTNLALIDSFAETDDIRLKEVLKDAYIPFTESEKTKLKSVIGLIISELLFMDYAYAIDNEQNSNGQKQTEFYNPTTLEHNIYLHVWGVFSTSPFENCCVFTTETPAVNNVTVSPAEASVLPGQSIQLSTVVETTGFANKSVVYTTENENVSLSQNGRLFIPNDVTTGTEIIVTATSVYDKTKKGQATITVV